jgi:regulator of sigma E protease
MAILIFVVVLAVLILVHEFGHFIFAKLFRMRVDEFGVGFPPRIFGKKFGETIYSVNWIPFGGFVKIAGEDGDAEGGDNRNFSSKHWSKQILVLVAGVLFNLILAWAILSGSFIAGMPLSSSGELGARTEQAELLVVGVSKGSPAEEAGIKVGDEILFVESNGVEVQGEELTPESFQNTILNGQGDAVTISYRSKNQSVEGLLTTVVVTPSFDVIPDRPVVGLSTDKVGIVKLPIFQSLVQGFLMTMSVFAAVAVGLFTLLIDAFRGAADISQITGPVGIVGFIGDASTLGLSYLLSFTAFISINLAVINLIPFPALDGGRVLFVLIETILGKKISPKVSGVMNLVGFALLILFMIVVTYNDIARLIS